LLVSQDSRKCGCTTTASRKAVAEDIKGLPPLPPTPEESAMNGTNLNIMHI
jgi:hypothetical protein